jgi:hypothetical protein
VFAENGDDGNADGGAGAFAGQALADKSLADGLVTLRNRLA